MTLLRLFRVLLSAAAYVLFETIRRVALEGGELARAQVGTIRLLFANGYPYQELF
jgi:hypothetical protein